MADEADEGGRSDLPTRGRGRDTSAVQRSATAQRAAPLRHPPLITRR